MAAAAADDVVEGEALISSIDMTAPEVVVSMGLVELEDEINPWGFLRIVDVTDLDDDGSWEEIATYKAPHVDTLDQPGGGRSPRTTR